MKVFFRDVLFTVLFAGLLIVVLDVAIFRTSNELSYKDWYMTENADRIKTLLLGGSLFANSFDPHELGDSVFDAASDARRLYYDVNILKKYAPNMHHLETVMVSLHISMNPNPQSSLFLRYPYARYMGIPFGSNPLQFSPLFSGHFTFHALSSISIDPRILNKKNDSDIGMDSVGYSPLFRVWDGHSLYVPIPSYEEALSCRDAFIRHITEMATYCDSINVRLICVLPPVTDFYIGMVDSRLYDLIETVIPQLSKEYNFEYKLYHNDLEFRDNDLYADGLHLNYRGAVLFAKRVKRDFNL